MIHRMSLLVIAILFLLSCCTKTIILTPKEKFLQDHPAEATKYNKLEIDSIYAKIDGIENEHIAAISLLRRIKKFDNLEELLEYVAHIEKRKNELYEMDLAAIR